MYASTNSVLKLQTLTTMDPKYSKENSIKVKPDATKITNTLKKSLSCRERSGRSTEKPGSTDTMSAPSIQLRFFGQL